MSGSNRPRVTDMLEELVKKDEDTRIYSINYATGEVDLETNLDLEGHDAGIAHVIHQPEPVLDSAMLRDDATGPSANVPIRIAYTVYMALAVFHFITIMLGIIVYFVLLYDESRQVAIVMFSMTATLTAVFYALMTWQREQELGPAFGMCMATCRIFCVATLSALFQNEILFLLEVVYLYQTAFLSVYTTHRPRTEAEEDAQTTGVWDSRLLLGKIRSSRYSTIVFYWLLFSSTAIWIVGLLFFIQYLNRELMWLWACLSFPMVISTVVYRVRFLASLISSNSNSYSLSTPHRKTATIDYYARPLLAVWNKVNSI